MGWGNNGGGTLTDRRQRSPVLSGRPGRASARAKGAPFSDGEASVSLAEPSAFFIDVFQGVVPAASEASEETRRRKRSGRSVLPGDAQFDAVTAVEEWAATLAAAGELTSEAADAIIATHGDRGVRAIEAVGERRVKEYRDFTVVVGHSEEYVVENGVCECEDARYNLDPEDPTDLCWHVIAAKVARRIGAVDHHDMWYSEVREFL